MHNISFVLKSSHRRSIASFSRHCARMTIFLSISISASVLATFRHLVVRVSILVTAFSRARREGWTLVGTEGSRLNFLSFDAASLSLYSACSYLHFSEVKYDRVSNSMKCLTQRACCNCGGHNNGLLTVCGSSLIVIINLHHEPYWATYMKALWIWRSH
ncbi:hypothetical protein F4810DRAFT_633507 [Camillea tinctor]|nr:hypothetical protein F4810DRAFT_633507 [Camillea tinctor]